MNEPVNAGPVEQFYPGVLHAIEIEGESVALVRVGDAFYAFSNYCPHAGIEMTGSLVFDSEVTCWWHGSTFDLRTGETISGPSYDPLVLYKAYAVDGSVFVSKTQINLSPR